MLPFYFTFGAIPLPLSLLLSTVVYGLIMIDIYNSLYLLLLSSNTGIPADLLLMYSCSVLPWYGSQSSLHNFPSLIRVDQDQVVKSRTAVMMQTPGY